MYKQEKEHARPASQQSDRPASAPILQPTRSCALGASRGALYCVSSQHVKRQVSQGHEGCSCEKNHCAGYQARKSSGPHSGGEGKRPDKSKVGADGCDARPKTDALIAGGIQGRSFKDRNRGGSYGIGSKRGGEARNRGAGQNNGPQSFCVELLVYFYPIPIAGQLGDSNTFLPEFFRA